MLEMPLPDRAARALGAAWVAIGERGGGARGGGARGGETVLGARALPVGSLLGSCCLITVSLYMHTQCSLGFSL